MVELLVVKLRGLVLTVGYWRSVLLLVHVELVLAEDVGSKVSWEV